MGQPKARVRIKTRQVPRQLRKQIMKIKTDSKELEESKNPDTCNCFALYKLLASKEQIKTMRENYINGGYGYGHAKQALFELILETFKEQRKKYDHLMAHPEEVEHVLKLGAIKAKVVAKDVLKRTRIKVGY